MARSPGAKRWLVSLLNVAHKYTLIDGVMGVWKLIGVLVFGMSDEYEGIRITKTKIVAKNK